ncbi:FAD binding domain-containing protein [Aquabacter spiritensis]|uniref:CO/xanthine dehydrogenase FAD-binding subunit n=1 Tax=Aquabacter spiritensis TaxID=933073 RepID=A0A4R3LRU5_9HYPH|nr:FAD binding domain-containing protein [Aquabacter spiritensis]TCT03212.1 CO/xanthine dehydrogenase FAD-binding subunit [Aquabacter spiritensis]
MDLNTVTAVSRPRDRAALSGWTEGDAFLAGGTWLFSEPQPDVRRLIDLSALDWPALTIGQDGLEIAATCTIAQLCHADLPPAWAAAPLIEACARCLMASFKVWNMATVGGNLCLALPAGAMISLVCGLDGTCLLWAPDGTERRIRALDFITGASRTDLRPGEILRAIHLPATALTRRAAMRQASLSALGRSAVLVIGTRPPEGGLSLTVTAAVPRPLRLEFSQDPDAAECAAALAAALPADAYFEDVHGARDWRRAMTLHLSEQVRAELAAGDAA